MAQSRLLKRRVTLANITKAATAVVLGWCASCNWQDFQDNVNLAFWGSSVLPLSWQRSPKQLQRRALRIGNQWCVMWPWQRGSACRATAGQEGADLSEWKDAYELEVERNRVLREQFSEQLALLGKPAAAAPTAAREPEACEVDWSLNYERLAAYNNALADEIAGLQREAKEDRPAVAEKRPVFFKIKMPSDDSLMSIELLPFFGGAGAFYSLYAEFPLGLKLTKVDKGSLMGAFLVEEVMKGGSAAAAGEVVEGDVLHALTMVGDQADLGMRTEDFVSSLVGGFGRFRQSLMDASFIDTTDDLVEMMQTNLVLGSDTKLALIFERDVNTLAPPANPLQPQSDA